MLPTDLRDRLHAAPPVADPLSRARHGDHQFSPGIPDMSDGPPRAAAVLIPIVLRATGPTILFTRRAAHLKTHSGQIAFPGGRIDDGDAGALGAALREAQEEIGLDPASVEPIGYLDLYQSTSGYQITPVVGLVRPPVELTINPEEVEDTFEAPFAFLMDERNHRLESREWRGALRTYVAIPFGAHYIWGVTAGILRNLHAKVAL